MGHGSQRFGAAGGIVAASPRRHEGHRRCVVTVRERDAREGRRAERSAHAGHDLEVHPVLREEQRLFGAAAKDEGVAAFEPRNPTALPRPPEQRVVDLVLRRRRSIAALAREEDLRVGARQGEHRGMDEGVVQHDVGLGDHAARHGRDELRMAGSDPDERDDS